MKRKSYFAYNVKKCAQNRQKLSNCMARKKMLKTFFYTIFFPRNRIHKISFFAY